MLVTATRQRYENHLWLAPKRVAQIKTDEPFSIFVANFGKKSKTLLQNQHIADAEDHLTALMEFGMTHAALLGITVEVESTTFNQNQKGSPKIS